MVDLHLAARSGLQLTTSLPYELDKASRWRWSCTQPSILSGGAARDSVPAPRRNSQGGGWWSQTRPSAMGCSLRPSCATS